MKKVIGIDIGGTKISFGIMDERGNLLKNIVKPTQSNREDIIESILTNIRELNDGDIAAIGISTAGFIDTIQGKILFAGNINGWTGFHLKKSLENLINIPVFVANDANMAALAEKWIGNAKEFDNFIMLTMGTGLGGAIYDKRIGFWEGATYQGGELGHIIMYPEGRLCTCNQRGCAEKYIAGSALSLNYEELTGKNLTGYEIIERLGVDENAKKALEKLSRDLALYISTIKNIFDPEGVVIGGGFSETSKYWLNSTIENYLKICNRPGDMKIVIGKFLNDAGVIGACRYAFLKLEENNG
ncbi:ROK family protein [Lagierella sp.]|uniref:ROK family protein n=1 Tax=Lagierella sp. TaxID=2849657 RepID=UPI0026104A88|nr:ROK family protein [Lagierella sp.]